jgi:predicted Zn-dependent peptidase
MEGTKTATVLVLVGTGSRYETKNINGISHFLEHMMFKGTTKRPDKIQIVKELESIGAEYNAFTSKEYTGYYARASAEKLDLMTDVISDIFLNSLLDGKEIEMERGVIVEEINMYQDMPSRYIGDLFEGLLYKDQPMGWNIAGEKETVTAIKREEFVNYFNSHYIAENTVVAIAGNVTDENATALVEKYFSNAREGSPVIKVPVADEQSGPKSLVHFKETDQAHFHVGVRAFDMFDDRRYPLSLLNMIFGGGMTSRLFQEVREKRGLAYYVGASSDLYTDCGVFLARAGVNKDKTVEAIEVVLEEMRKIKETGVTEAELQQAKDHLNGSMAIYLESSMNMASDYCESVLFEKKVLTPEERLGKINSVKLEEVNRLAWELLDTSKLNFAIIGPYKDADQFNKILKI